MIVNGSVISDELQPGRLTGIFESFDVPFVDEDVVWKLSSIHHGYN